MTITAQRPRHSGGPKGLLSVSGYPGPRGRAGNRSNGFAIVDTFDLPNESGEAVSKGAARGRSEESPRRAGWLVPAFVLEV